MATYHLLFYQPPREGYEFKTGPSGFNLEGVENFPSEGVPSIYPQSDYIQTVSITRPTPAPPAILPGSCVPAYKKWLYNQIHVIPSMVNRGRLLSNYDSSVEVWNAYTEETRILNSIDYPPVAETGTSLTGVTGVVPPPTDDYAPTQSKIFNLHIDFEGPPSADALFEFNFDSEMATLFVTGYRLVVFGFIPEMEMIERYRWLTDLIPSYDGREQYVKVRPIPRREYLYRYIGEDTVKRGDYYNIIAAGMAFDWGVPIWEQAKHLTDTVTANSYEILVDTSEAEYEVGKGCFIWSNDSDNESAVIEQILVDRLTVLSPIQGTYDIDSYVMPLAVCKMEQSVDSALSVLNATEFNMVFRAIESSPVAPADLPDQYKSLDVLHDCPEVSGTVTWTHTGNWQLLDFSTGIVANDYAQQYGKTTRGFQKTFTDHSSMWAFRRWLYKVAGRVGKFWIPSYTGKLKLVKNIVDGDVLIDFVNTNLTALFANTPFVTDVEFLYWDGTFDRFDVTNVELLSSTVERMTVNPAFDKDVPITDVRSVSLLHQVRLDSDTIDFRWDQAGNCTVSFNAREVIQ